MEKLFLHRLYGFADYLGAFFDTAIVLKGLSSCIMSEH